jgi:hypothetical protein
MGQPTPESAERQRSTGQSESSELETGGKTMAAPAFQLKASPVVQRATPGARYEKGNSPDPNNSVGGAEIRSSEGRVANVGDNVTFSIHGLADGYQSISWRANNDLTYAPKSGVPAVYYSNKTGKSVTLGAGIQGVHTIIATVTPASGPAYELKYILNVEPKSRDYAGDISAKPSPLSTMDDFIALVERIENAYPTLAWQDVVSKIRAEQYPARGGEGSGWKRAYTWDDLIDDQDEIAPLQASIANPADIQALRTSQTVTSNGKSIDIGHVLTGVDAMNFPTTAGIFKNNNMSGPAAATWSGDVGSSLVNWANDKYDADKELFYKKFSSMDDLLGDMDGINLGGLPSLPASAKLSQRLRTYYKTAQTTGADKRYTNFCAVSGFDVSGGKLGTAAKAYIRQQILNFSHGYNVKGSITDALIMSGGGMGGYGGGYVSPETLKMTTMARIEDNVDWFTNRFIKDIEAGLATEK